MTTTEEHKRDIVRILKYETCEIVKQFWSPKNRLKEHCTQICDAILNSVSPQLSHIPEFTLSYIVGTWQGPVENSEDVSNVCGYDSDKYSVYETFEMKYPPHQWLCARLGGVPIVQFDPTYTQFDKTSKWSWEGCLLVVDQYCVPDDEKSEFTTVIDEYNKKSYSRGQSD